MRCNVCKQNFTYRLVKTNVMDLCLACAQKPRYKYFYRSLPRSQPPGFVDREVWAPPQLFNCGQLALEYMHGSVDYHEPLSPGRLDEHDLLPRSAWETESYVEREIDSLTRPDVTWEELRRGYSYENGDMANEKL